MSEVPVEYDLLLERLSKETLDRLQDEPAPNTRVLLFGFPAQMARLKQSIHDFLNQIFEPTRYHANAALRKHGRRLGPDPASGHAATIGGVIANNAGGMRCTLKRDAYHTVSALTFVLVSLTPGNAATIGLTNIA